MEPLGLSGNSYGSGIPNRPYFLKEEEDMMEAMKFSVVQGVDALFTQVMPEVVRLACMAFIVLAIYNAGRGTK
jgi:hypothetical protein